MLQLHGSPVSNYYNKVKHALLEKGIPFEEVDATAVSQDPAVLAVSPLGKIPFVTTAQGSLCESQVILEYIESLHPRPPLLPAEPFAAAKVRELVTFLDWHLEMAARQLYGPAFFGAAPLSEANAARIRRELEQRIRGFQRLARFAPYVVGDTFTMADCCAFANLPLVAMASKAVYGEDPAGRRRHRPQELRAVHRRAPGRAEGGRRPQGGAGALQAEGARRAEGVSLAP